MFWKLVKHNQYRGMELCAKPPIMPSNNNIFTSSFFSSGFVQRKNENKFKHTNRHDHLKAKKNWLKKRIHQITCFHESCIQRADQRINFIVGYSIGWQRNSIPNLWTQTNCTNDPSQTSTSQTQNFGTMKYAITLCCAWANLAKRYFSFMNIIK